jgi:hypothetical protein
LVVVERSDRNARTPPRTARNCEERNTSTEIGTGEPLVPGEGMATDRLF